jgi:predicted lipoprotein with Yx(FWY)xxD motif
MKRQLFPLLLAGVLILPACGDSGGEGSDVTDAAGDSMSTASTDLGTVLVDPDGFTVYIFLNDTNGESTCYDSCAATWPAVPGDTAISTDLDDSIFGTTTRTDGTEQLTVDGQPLYRYAPDANPGHTTGQGVGDVWFVVGADGAMIGGPEATATTGGGKYGAGGG